METKSAEWVEQTEAKIREAFDLFDKDKADAIIQEEVGTVMRALGAYPTERQLVLEILPEVQDDEPTGFVSYQKFEKKMLSILASKECDPDSGDCTLLMHYADHSTVMLYCRTGRGSAAARLPHHR